MSKILTVRLYITCAVLLSITSPALSSVAYQNALRCYAKERYDSTLIILKNYLRQHGTSPEAEQMVPLVMEAMIRRNDFGSVHRLFDMYRQKYPSSAYIPRMWYTEGIARAKEYKYAMSIQAFSSALNAGVSRALDSLILLNTDRICSNALTADELVALGGRSDIQNRLQEVIRYYSIVKLHNAGQLARARSIGDDFRNAFPRSRFENTLRDLFSRSREESRDLIQIGVIAPVTGDDAEVGKKVIQGVQLAFDAHNAQRTPRVKSIICDEQSSAVETAFRTKELIQDHKVPVIIGPVLSHTAAVCAAMSNGKNVVMISPTATDDGIAQIGDNVFQMNVTLGVLGQRIARYAIENLNLREFVIIAPRTTYGTITARAFRDEVKSHGGDIIAEESFDEGTNDYTPQFTNLRNFLLLRKLDKQAMEKGIDYRPVRRISRADSIKYADSSLAFGGLFIPAEAEDVILLAPSVAFNRIKTQMFGTSGWNNPKILTDAKDYAVNTLLSTSFEPQTDRKEWNDFKHAYKTRYNSEPDRIAALGYDAAALVLKALGDCGWSTDAGRISKALTAIQQHQGLSGLISFDKNRTNTEAAVLKINASGYVRVQ